MYLQYVQYSYRVRGNLSPSSLQKQTFTALTSVCFPGRASERTDGNLAVKLYNENVHLSIFSVRLSFCFYIIVF